jgi:hypothetical protein
METVVTTKFEEARRSRLALFGGRGRTLEIAGACYTGIVHSVCEIASSHPPAWRVTFITVERAPRTNAAKLGPASGKTTTV